ncbi:HPP family protein, partial [Acinetobacter baumannii]|nr:HPP family protein [Acinetobacter baumannii]
MFSIFYGKEKLAPSPTKVDVLRSLVGGTLSIFILLW